MIKIKITSMDKYWFKNTHTHGQESIQVYIKCHKDIANFRIDQVVYFLTSENLMKNI